jgi:hypothetical protein
MKCAIEIISTEKIDKPITIKCIEDSVVAQAAMRFASCRKGLDF